MSVRLLLPILGLVLLAVSGCVTKKSSSTTLTLRELSGDENARLAQGIRLRSGDIIDVRLGGVPREEIEQVTGTYSVDTQGFLNVPQVGRVRADGLTQEALQTAIEETYRAKGIYSNPTVTVSVPPTARFVNVGGEVRLPQRVPYTPDLTVLSAITAAGGVTEYASQTRIRLYRGLESIPVSLRKIRRDPGNDIPLQPGDTIEVMRSFF